jgi:hypothetical protein
MADRKCLSGWAKEGAKKFSNADLDAEAWIKVTVLKGQNDDFNDYGGYRSGGYMLVLKNRADEIVFTKSSKTLWERSAKSIVNAKERLGYDREFKYGDELRTTYGLPGSVR